MDDIEFSEILASALADYDGYSDDTRPRVRTFEQEGVLTSDKGLVVKFANGAEFQITIVQSKGSRDDE